MTAYADADIRAAITRGDIEIDGLDLDAALQPSSIDITLGDTLAVFEPGVIDPRYPPEPVTASLAESAGFIIVPGGFALGVTAQRLRLCDHVRARIEGRSHLARLGLQIHATAGFIDPGWDGFLTLEISNVNRACAIQLRAGMPIAQLSFESLKSCAERPYGASGLGSKFTGLAAPESFVAEMQRDGSTPPKPCSRKLGVWQ